MKWRLLLFVAGLLAYAGALWEPVWSTIDDGDNLTWTLEVRQQLQEGKVSLETFNSTFGMAGRYRPGYLMFGLAKYELFGLDCWKHHLAHVLAMLAAAQLLYGIAKRATGSAIAGFLSAFLFTFCGTNMDNWCRLDMDEFYVGCLAVSAVWLFTLALAQPAERGAIRWGCAALGLAAIWMAFLTKETAPALTGVAAAVWVASLLGAGDLLARRNRAMCTTLLVAHFVMLLCLVWLRRTSSVRSMTEDVYTSAYQVRPDVMLSTAIKYADSIWNAYQLLVPVALALLAWRLYLWSRHKRELDAWDGWAFVGLAWFGAFLAVLLPWKVPLARYLGPALPGLALFTALMITRFLLDSRPSPGARRSFGTMALRWLLIANLVFVPISGVIRIYNYTIFRHDYDQAAMNVMATLASHAPASARLYINCPPDYHGCFREMTRFFPLLFDRHDLSLHYLNSPGQPAPRANDYLLAFSREGSPRNIEVTLPATFHDQTLPRIAHRLDLLSTFRYDRHLLNAYPDAPLFNAVARLGIRLPDYLGMQAGHKRTLFAWERSLVEWRIYRFVQ